MTWLYDAHLFLFQFISIFIFCIYLLMCQNIFNQEININFSLKFFTLFNVH